MNTLSGEAEYHIAYEHSDPEGNLHDPANMVTSGNSENSRFVFSQDTTPARAGRAHYVYI